MNPLRRILAKRRLKRSLKPRPIRRWGVLWRSCNRLDGERAHIVCEDCQPALFRTRREARAFIKDRYGFIKTRPDLQQEPHGWKMPVPVRLKVMV